MRKFLLNDLISRETAVDKLIKYWDVQSNVEIIKLEDSLGRVSSMDIFSINSLPVYRASMADGIAVRKSDFKNGLPDTSNWVKNKDYAQADTGDDFPDEFDCVVRIEDVSFDGERPIFTTTMSVFEIDNIRQCGKTITKGELILKKDTKISEMQLVTLAAGGIEKLSVYKKPRVIFIPTGNELVPRGTVPARGKNIESNSIMVKAMLEKMGAEFICYDIVKDDIKQLSDAVERALNDGDIIIICAGSAKGEEDYTHVVLNKYGKVLQHGILTVPGRPTGFAIAKNKPIINIPGPTLGAYCAVDLCIAPLIDKLLHQGREKREIIKITLGHDIKTSGVMEFIIRMNVIEKAGIIIGNSVPFTASLPTIARDCNALLFVPIGVKGYKKGQQVEVELLHGRKNLSVNEVEHEHANKEKFPKRVSVKGISGKSKKHIR